MNCTKLLLFWIVWLSPILGRSQAAYIKIVPAGQQHPWWCYAAATEMVLKSINPSFSVPQCEIVKVIMNTTCDCCLYRDCPKGSNSKVNHRNTQCDNLCNMGLKSIYYANWKFFLKNKGYVNAEINTISFENIQLSFSDPLKKYPVIIMAGISSTLTHAIVVSGYYVTKTNTHGQPIEAHLLCNDPADQCSGCSFLMTYDIQANKFISKSGNSKFGTIVSGQWIKMIFHKP